MYSLGQKILLYTADMSNSIETAIAIAFGTIAIGIDIAKAIFQLLLCY